MPGYFSLHVRSRNVSTVLSIGIVCLFYGQWVLRSHALVLASFDFQNHYVPVYHSDLSPRYTGSHHQGCMHCVMIHMQHQLLSFHEDFQ